MRNLHIDAFAGISGDMTVSALRDLGVPEEVFQEALLALSLPLPGCRFTRDLRNGISGWRFKVEGHDGEDGAAVRNDRHPHGEEHSHHHDHEHSHGHQRGHSHAHEHEVSGHAHGRNHAEIVALLEQSQLSPAVRNRALSVFRRIAIAEGAIHGVPPENVGFHEVGAVDSIADIVCACAGFDFLKIDRITCGELIEGSGHIHCAHGTFPLPAPATLAILKGIPLRQVHEPWEHITPTGAAIVAEFAASFTPMPEMSVESIGYGLGSRQTPNRPNVLRLILGVDVTKDDADTDEIMELRCNLDDLSPEHASNALDQIIKEGALDATLTPTVMKKGRSGWILEVLCSETDTRKFSEIMMRHTTAFGIRMHRMQRLKLQRHHREVSTEYGPILIKVGLLGDEVIQMSPEFSSCSEAATHHRVAVRDVHSAALRAIAASKN